MLQLQSSDTVRIPLGSGAFAVLAPIDSVAWMNGQAAARAAAAAAEGEDSQARIRYALIASLAHENLQALEGVADIDGTSIEGQPTAEQIDRLLSWFPAYRALEAEYAGPMLEAQSEKNASAPSLDGSSIQTGATDTAEGATPTETPAKPDAGSAQPA